MPLDVAGLVPEDRRRLVAAAGIAKGLADHFVDHREAIMLGLAFGIQAARYPGADRMAELINLGLREEGQPLEVLEREIGALLREAASGNPTPAKDFFGVDARDGLLPDQWSWEPVPGCPCSGQCHKSLSPCSLTCYGHDPRTIR